MKCIQYKSSNAIVRVADGDAHTAVREGVASYVSKSKFKEQQAKAAK